MRVYEFAGKIGATYADVVKLAEANEVEVYSPLSELESDDVETLNAAYLKVGPEKFKASAAAMKERRKANASKVKAARTAKAKDEAAKLEASRQRAIAAAEGRTIAPKTAAPAPAKPQREKTEEIKVELPDQPKITIQVSAPPEDDDEPMDTDVASGRRDLDDDDDDDDADDALKYLHGKDRVMRPTGKAAALSQKGQTQSQKSDDNEPPMKQSQKQNPRQPQKQSQKQPAKPGQDRQDGRQDRRDGRQGRPMDASGASAKASAQTAKPAQQQGKKQRPERPGFQRVGGTRAGFSSVSMKTSSAQAFAAPVKPTITLSVSTREISVRGAVVVKELAAKLGVRPNRLIADLMGLKVLATINQRVEPDVASKVAQKYGYRVVVEHARDAANKKPILKSIDADDDIPQDRPDQLEPRPPVVTFLGHVDHGKTTLMDYIRHAHVAAGEAGGITQQISAYQVDVQGRSITFLDTPGHAAFSAMRQRGAQLTDIAVLIIAADDGIMPQTEEAIRCARQAGVQIMVAITKCDKPTANTDRVKQQLQKRGLTPEDWGGDIVCCEVSGTTGKGVDNLLEMILLQADMLELAANPRRRANGYVVEAELEQGFGPTATILVTGGTLKVGDAILVGEHFGKVRSLIDDRGRRVKSAGPSVPVKCTGLSGVPEAGAEFRVMLDEKRARTLAEEAALARKEQELSAPKALSFDDLMSQMGSGERRELSIVVKSDTQGSLEAIVESLRGIKSEKVSLKIISTGTGNVSLTDVKSASAGKAIIVGFDIGTDSGVQQQARHDGVRINSFRIIYELMDFVKKSMLDLLPPEYKEVVKGHATIKAIYDIGKIGKIAGSQMLDGSLIASARYRIMRNGAKVWDGKLQTLRHFKDEVKEVTGQQECGVCFQNYEDFAEGDTIECYVLEELPKTL